MTDPEVMMLQKRFDIPSTLARILVLLAKSETVTVAMIVKDHAITKDARVAMHRLRHALLNTGIEIKSRRNLGYWLEKEDRDLVAQKMIPDQMVLPLVGGGASGSEAAA